MKLGLDISTTTVGWCVLLDDNSFVDAGYISLSDEKGLYDKACKALSELSGVFIRNNITKVQIEEYLGNFAPGKGSILTVIMLASFNGILSYEVRKSFGIDPIKVHASSARKAVGFSMTKGMQALKKQSGDKNFTKHKVAEICLGIEPLLENKKELNSKSNIREEFYDLIDAYVIARFGG